MLAQESKEIEAAAETVFKISAEKKIGITISLSTLADFYAIPNITVQCAEQLLHKESERNNVIYFTQDKFSPLITLVYI